MTSFKFLTFILLAVSVLYSIETNAASITADKCTLGLLPFGSTMMLESKKNEIIKAYEEKGFNVTELTSPLEVADVEYISDATVECTSTYFGTMAKTSIRLIEASTNKILFRTISPASMDLFLCKIDLFSAIKALPDCQIK